MNALDQRVVISEVFKNPMALLVKRLRKNTVDKRRFAAKEVAMLGTSQFDILTSPSSRITASSKDYRVSTWKCDGYVYMMSIDPLRRLRRVKKSEKTQCHNKLENKFLFSLPVLGLPGRAQKNQTGPEKSV